jgi:hypothetical protein
MDSVNENYSKSEVCMEVRFLQAEGLRKSEIRHGLVWSVNKLKAGQMALNDDTGKYRADREPRKLTIIVSLLKVW